MYWSRILAIGLASALVVGCTDNRSVDDVHRIRELYFPIELAPSETTKVATCQAGDVLLGGGYVISYASLDLTDAVGVTANRPDGDIEWIFTVVLSADTPPTSVSVSLYLYCLARADSAAISVSPHTVAGQAVSLPRSTSGIDIGNSTATCPSGETLTAGGFAIDIGAPERSVTFNSWISSSLPSADRRSWTSTAAFIEDGDEPIPTIRAYAQCVSDTDSVLREFAAPDAESTSESVFNYVFYNGRATCGDAAFATGGGFRFAGDPLVPHSILTNSSSDELSGWGSRGVLGFETGTTAGLTVRPLCFEGLPVERPDQVDLVVLIGDNPHQEAGCPGGSTDCFAFTVLNLGTATSPATVVDVAIPGDVVRTALSPLTAGESVNLTIAIGDPCDSNCSASVTVDPDGNVPESDEANNSAEWFIVG